MRLPHTRDLAGLDVALLGIPFDGGVSYRPGPRFAPREIRQHSSLIRPYHPVHDISPFDILRVADTGDVDTNPLNIEDTYARVRTAVGAILEAGAIPICVGGDHSLSLPILRAIVERQGPVGLVHVDSHQDMWDEYFGNRYFHGTPFRRAVEEGLLDGGRVVQIGIRGPVYDASDFDFGRAHGVRTLRAEEIGRRGIEWVKEEMRAVHGGPVYRARPRVRQDQRTSRGRTSPSPTWRHFPKMTLSRSSEGSGTRRRYTGARRWASSSRWRTA